MPSPKPQDHSAYRAQCPVSEWAFPWDIKSVVRHQPARAPGKARFDDTSSFVPNLDFSPGRGISTGDLEQGPKGPLEASCFFVLPGFRRIQGFSYRKRHRLPHLRQRGFRRLCL